MIRMQLTQPDTHRMTNLTVTPFTLQGQYDDVTREQSNHRPDPGLER